MPIVTIQTPSGESIKIEAPEGATDQQIFSFAKSQGLFDKVDGQKEISDDFIPTDENLSAPLPERPESSLLDSAIGAAEALGTTVTGATTGALGFGIGSLEGAIGELTGRLEKGEGLETAQRYAEALTFLPKTAEGQEIVKFIGEKLSALPPTLGGAPVAPISSINPAIQSVKQGIKAVKTTLGESLLPVGLVKTAANKGNIKNFRLPKDNGLKRKLLAEQTAAENPDIAAVTKMITDSGEIVTNQRSKLALKQLTKDVGDEKAVQVVSVIENMKKGSKKDFNDMLNIVQKGYDKPLFGQENRPSDILGRAVAQRASAIDKINKQASMEIGNIARKELSKETFDISSASNRFFEGMEELGVKAVRADDNTVSFDFSQSKFVGGNKEMLNRLANFVKDGESNGLDAHTTKQFARELVSFGEGTESAISTKSQAPIKSLASDINAILVNSNKRYGKANKRFADTIDIKERFDKMVKGVDVNDELAGQSLANKARRLVSNAASRTEIKQLINEAEAVLSDRGVNYKNDINSLNFAVTTLEDAFKITPAASIQGNLQRAGANLIEGVSPELAVTRGIMDKVFNLDKPSFNKKMKTFRLLSETGQN